MQSYLKYKRYYDKKATATLLKVNDYCYVLNLNADNQSMKFEFKDYIWTGPYIVVKFLSNNNYVERRTGARYIQTLRKIRLRLCAPNQRVPEVTVKVEDQLPNTEVKTTQDDLYAQAGETEFGESLFGNASKKSEGATITEVPIDDVTTTQNEDVIATADENSAEDKKSFGNNTSFNVDVSDNSHIMTPPLIESPAIPPTLPSIVVGNIPRKMGRYNLRTNPKPNAHPVFRLLEAVTTDGMPQRQD